MRIDWRDPDGRPEGAVTRAAALRWTAAGLAVVALHAGGIWLALHWPAQAEAPGDPPAAIMMELAPLAVAPEAPQQDIAPGPQMVEAEEQPDEPDKPVEEKPDPTPPEVKEAEVKLPETPKVEKAEVVLPAKVEPKPKPKPKKKKQKKAPRTTAPQSSQAQRADRAAAPAAGMASSMSPASWKGALMAHLNRHKRFPSGAGAGVATVAFTIDRSGRVLSARLVRSAGDGMLDAEAVSLPRRASPVPAPPPNIGGGSITLAVPIRFNR
ncbi:TonB like protein [Nitrobacter sp. Nb-311A]|uniref:energy transducer TonB family protein n=2 Tax=Nitrobacter sp. Nb-311A TaxID=314253 RepID=UPI0000684C02|nr:energy transducer TonB [Nitrobacter sp. Nb-311A]EAQ36898.1 TonB like protein [Nitrobacter sp. Nb-311A]MCV0384805.1 energy transducer TonB [Erythrobacter sp.]